MICLKLSNYVVIKRVMYYNDFGYTCYDTNTKIKNNYCYYSGSPIEIKNAILHYYQQGPKWLLFYSLKNKYLGWVDIFQHHLLPYYFYN